MLYHSNVELYFGITPLAVHYQKMYCINANLKLINGKYIHFIESSFIYVFVKFN